MRGKAFWSLLIVVALSAVACGDDPPLGTVAGSAPDPTDSTAPPQTAPPQTAPPETAPPETAPPETAPPETAPPQTAPPETASPTQPPQPTASDALADFFAAAADLDRRIRDAAGVFNAGLDADAVTLDPGVGPVVDALDAEPLRHLIPAGMSPELERAVLAVYADLDSRISALAGGVRNIHFAGNLQWGLDCLANGGRSADRFAADLDEARTRAAAEPPPTGAADSEAAGVMAVRLEAIGSMNWGCESCGGVEYDQPFPVDWVGRTLLEGVGFEADFVGGAWDIGIYAC